MLRQGAQATVKLCVRKCNAACQLQQKRTELIFRRMFPVTKVEELPVVDQEKRTGGSERVDEPFTYIMLENTLSKKAGDMDVILTTDIDEFGTEGEVVSVSKYIARKYLLPLGMAVYKSPENMAKFERIREESASIRKQTKSGQRTVKQLAAMTLPIPMNPNAEWILSKTHVRIALRKVGVYLPERAITLPSNPVTEMGEIELHVTVNDLDTVALKGVVYELTKDTQYPQDFKVWRDTRIPLVKLIENAYFRKNGKKQRSTAVNE